MANQKTLAYFAFGIAAIIVIVIFTYKCAQSENTSNPKNIRSLASNDMPSRAQWFYKTSFTKDVNYIPEPFASFLEPFKKPTVTTSNPIETDESRREASNGISTWRELSNSTHFQLSWSILRITEPNNTAVLTSDSIGRTVEENGQKRFQIKSWNWKKPMPSDSRRGNRHAEGLDDVDFMHFTSSSDVRVICDVLVLSTGVEQEVKVTAQQVQKAKSIAPFVIVADSSTVVDVLNVLLAKDPNCAICFLLHTTC